jgi:hypothetical protein
MRVINNKALEFDLEDKDLIYKSSLTSLFYPEIAEPIVFSPKQLHFHMGNGSSVNP